MDLTELILLLRPDLCRRYKFDRKENKTAFLSWLVTSGLREYRALAQDEDLKEKLTQSADDENLNVLQHLVWHARPDVGLALNGKSTGNDFKNWYYTHGILEHRLWPWLSVAERVRALNYPSPWPEHQLKLAHTVESDQGDVLAAWNRPFGVNIIGYVFGQLGIGEDARMAARAFLGAGVPVAMINFPPGKEIAQNDQTMAQYVQQDGPFAINIFCMTALETARFVAERGYRQLQGRYNIGYWPWELAQWPKPWRQLTDFVDEIWVSTRHTHSAVSAIFDHNKKSMPLHVMPMAVDVSRPKDERTMLQVRAQWNLPASAQLFCFSFDLNSSIHRKNPQAVVRAFQEAFSSSQWGVEEVGLVIKVHPPRRRHAAWSRLRAQADQDPRLHIIESTLDRSELLALYQACDCFVSLHRAEGFGRGIAEALQLGLHVIATNYSGNVDFCEADELSPLVRLVPARMIKIRRGQYPFGDGQLWASADISVAAKLMHDLATNKRNGRVPARKVPQGGWPRFTLKEVGQRYRQRLLQIWQQMQPSWQVQDHFP